MATPEQIIVGYNDAVHTIRSRVEAYARTAWLTAGSWRDADIDRLVRMIVPRVQAGQVKTAQLTAAYLAALETVRTGEPVPAVMVSRELVTSTRGVPAQDVYRRPAVTMYTALAGGAQVKDAIEMGASRLASLVSTDHQLAKTSQARESLSGRGFEYMRRTLTGRENCALCAIASTQRYRVQNLMPIHPGCDCGVDTVSAGSDPGQVLDPERLELIHGAIDAEFGGTDRGARYLDGRNDRSDFLDLITTAEHGEYGPTLTWRDQHFTGPSGFDTLN
ncbi:MAG TPA: hypothetical protein VNJ54_07975 [Plantibacter sp.]|uniref:hypothetical protein n=1 Tax=Plantibacter sp. TaxID=1871045 RepID=UPI002D0BE398|nr:hypothetical protein [Plantibacter sp.]